MANKYYIALLLKTGATPRQCLINAELTDEEADSIMRDPNTASGRGFTIQIPGLDNMEYVISSRKDLARWELWRAHMAPLFDTADEASAHGRRLLMQLNDKGKLQIYQFAVLMLREEEGRMLH
jgi:hypothetical protein